MVRTVFMGTPEFAVPALNTLLRGGYDVVGVLTRQDQPAGRGQQIEVISGEAGGDGERTAASAAPHITIIRGARPH